MIIRGAPAIGVAAAYGMYLGHEIQTHNRNEFLIQLEEVAQLLRSPSQLLIYLGDRTNAQNLMKPSVEQLKQVLLKTAQMINAEDLQTCRAIGDRGLEVPTTQKKSILTHCNWCVGNSWLRHRFGVVRSAWREGKLPRLPMKLVPAYRCKTDRLGMCAEGIQSP